MAATTITQFGDWTFADDGWSCKIGWPEARSQFSSNPVITPRAGSYPVISQGALSERTIQVTFVYPPTGTLPIDQAIQTLLGRLDPRDLTPRRLLATTFDGTIVQRDAMISLSDGWDAAQSMNTVYLTFVSDRPEWLAVATTTVTGPSLTDVGQQHVAVPAPNVGYAAVEPIVTLVPGALAHTTTTATVGWQYRRTIAFTNSSTRSWSNRPVRLDLGATDAIVAAAKAQADGDDLRVLLDGEELPRTLIAWNYAQTYVWVTPPPIAPAETVSFEIIYGNPSAANPPLLEGQLHPSIIYEYDTGTATSGSTTTLTDSGKTWTSTDKNWIGAFVTFLSGANAGTTKEITAQTTTSVTFAALGVAIAAGVKYLIAHSSNARWWYNTNEYFQSTSTPVRGRWYLNSKTKRPRVIDFSVPSAWAPFAMADNSDRFAQTSYSWLDKGGGSKPYAELDAYRTWEGGGSDGQLTTEDGQADGVAFSSCLPILKIKSLLKLSNNLNGMCQTVLMARAGGAESWETLDSVTANGTFTTSVTLPVDDQYYSLYQGLIPSDDEGMIRMDRARDAGSTSADGATRTTVTDAVAATQKLRKSPQANGTVVQDATPADITVTNSKTVERDGRRSGTWRGVIHTSVAGDEYKGWLPLAYLSGTDAGGDTLIDGSKNWITNELIGATLKITGSPNKTLNGKTATITANTATTITFSTGFAATVVQGTAYEIRQPKTTVRLTDDQYTWLDFDSSLITVGAISSEVAVYQVAAQLFVGTPDEINGRRVTARVGLDGRFVFLSNLERLVLDASTRTARIESQSTLAVLRVLTDPAARFEQSYFDYTANARITTKAGRWLPMAMGASALTNGDPTGPTIAPWTLGTPATGVTAAATFDTALGVNALKLAISASTAVAGDGLVKLFYPLIAVDPRESIYIPAQVRTSNANLQPYLGLVWYDGSTPIAGETYTINTFAPAINTWYPLALAAITFDSWVGFQLPTGTTPPLSKATVGGTSPTGFTLYLGVRSTVNNATGNVYFRIIDRGSPVLTVIESGMNQLIFGVKYQAAYL